MINWKPSAPNATVPIVYSTGEVGLQGDQQKLLFGIMPLSVPHVVSLFTIAISPLFT